MNPRAGERLTQWRKEKKLTQTELASKLGISQEFLSQIETGSADKSPSLKLATAIEGETGGVVLATSWVNQGTDQQVSP